MRIASGIAMVTYWLLLKSLSSPSDGSSACCAALVHLVGIGAGDLLDVCEDHVGERTGRSS